VASVGTPKAVTAGSATAMVTLNGVRYAPSTSADDDLSEFALIDLSLSGTSPTPFTYAPENVVINYGGGADPFTHPDDSNLYGPALGDNPTPYGPPPPLKPGTVANGQTARGLVLIRIGKHTPYILDLSDAQGRPVAQWALASK